MKSRQIKVVRSWLQLVWRSIPRVSFAELFAKSVKLGEWPAKVELGERVYSDGTPVPNECLPPHLQKKQDQP